MILRIDHVSVAVRDSKKAADFFCSVLGAIPGASFIDQELKYLGSIFSLGDLSRLEIVSPTGKGSFLDNFLKNREGVHHICLQTADIKKAKEQLDELGIPYFGYNEDACEAWKDLFIHPRDAFGVLIQIAQFEPNDYISDSLKLPQGVMWKIKKDKDRIALTLAHPGGSVFSLDLNREEVERLVGDLQKTLEL